MKRRADVRCQVAGCTREWDVAFGARRYCNPHHVVLRPKPFEVPPWAQAKARAVVHGEGWDDTEQLALLVSIALDEVAHGILD